MRKSFIIILLLILALPVMADGWDDFAAVENMWDGQKSITNKEFEDVINMLESKQKQKEEKQVKKKIKKASGGGNSLHPEYNVEKHINEIPAVTGKTEEGVLINVPVNLVLTDKVLEKGFYKVLGRKDENNKTYLSFYQSQFCKGELEVTETQDDFEEEEIDFAKLIPYNKSFMRMIFGSLDFNAWAFVPYIEEDETGF